MSVRFNPHYRLVIVKAIISGPARDVVAQLALDTGASVTTLSVALLQLAGCDPAAASARVQIATGSGTTSVPVLTVDRLEVLDQVRSSFPVLCHTLPPTVTVDGLLGLDFLRGHRLIIDFVVGRITLS